MKQEKWYKRLLCGYNPLGAFADIACKGTEVEYELLEQDKKRGAVEVRCWCCTFWRGVIIGAVGAAAAMGVWNVIT